jgi:hypothetical protein
MGPIFMLAPMEGAYLNLSIMGIPGLALITGLTAQ